MKQRVGIARAFAIEPKILLMDEPFSALDALTRGSRQEELLSICQTTQQTAFVINRAEFFTGRAEIAEFLARKWQREMEYRLIKEVWAYTDNRIAVRFAYEWHDDSGNWYRSYGNEQWEFDEAGLMRRREASINDARIAEADRKSAGS